MFSIFLCFFFFFSSRRRHTRSDREWSSDVCSSDLSHATLLYLPRSSANILIVRVSFSESLIEPFPIYRDKLVLKQLDFIPTHSARRPGFIVSQLLGCTIRERRDGHE